MFTRMTKLAVIVGGLLLAGAPLAAQSCGEWLWANPVPQGNLLSAVAYGNGLYVTVGRAGTILSSPDGAAWTQEIANPKVELFDVLWSGSQFLAVGEGGAILTSADGRLWVFQRSGISATLRKVAWNGDLFVAVGDGGAVASSSNGRDWTARVPATDSILRGVAWSGRQFLAVGDLAPSSPARMGSAGPGPLSKSSTSSTQWSGTDRAS